jgi:hypothetical protein
MRRVLATGFALTTALCTFGFAAGQSTGDKMAAMGSSMTSMTGMSHTFKISAQNGSGENGTAKLTQHGNALLVKLAITGGSGPQPAHIHKGTCANLDPKPTYPLETITGGTSTTTLKGVKLSQLMSGTYAINVHKSTTDLKDYVACGDLSAGAK